MRWWREIKDRHGGWPLPLLIAIGIGLAIAVGATVAYFQAEVLTAPGEPVWSTLTSAQLLEIARTSTFALGAIGGVAALLMAYRRQKLNEATHQHELAKHDATHRLEIEKQLSARVAGLHDRYTKSVEQLADTRASIRLGAVHAIEALAEDWLAIDNHRQRQVCVNLLCSYLGSLDQPRDENSIQNILAAYDDADERRRPDHSPPGWSAAHPTRCAGYPDNPLAIRELPTPPDPRTCASSARMEL